MTNKIAKLVFHCALAIIGYCIGYFGTLGFYALAQKLSNEE